tara:strand:- start:958 stop:1167 length:210 start_codon:yes stop_codon:yes gene_type:complete
METKMLNGISVELTADELAEHETAQATAQATMQVEKDEKVITDAKKASGKQKLKDLGLDDAEIKALTGV